MRFSLVLSIAALAAPVFGYLGDTILENLAELNKETADIQNALDKWEDHRDSLHVRNTINLLQADLYTVRSLTKKTKPVDAKTADRIINLAQNWNSATNATFTNVIRRQADFPEDGGIRRDVIQFIGDCKKFTIEWSQTVQSKVPKKNAGKIAEIFGQVAASYDKAAASFKPKPK